VNRGCISEKQDPPASLSKSVAPVNIFSVHEKLRIQQANLLESFAPSHYEPAIEHFYRPGSLMVEVCHEQTSPKP
jgi:hypothetical protein